MKLHYITIAIFNLSLLSFTTCNQHHMVCKTVNDIFIERDAGSESSSGVRRLQGPPGKRGPPGIRGISGAPGISGPPGAPAIVDYDRINQAISQKVAFAVAEINSRITELERNFTEFTRVERTCVDGGGLYFRQKCYSIPRFTSYVDLSRSQAIAECAKTGALLAEIHDRTQQKALYDFAVGKLPSGRSHANLWLGMDYEPSTQTMIYRSGERKDGRSLLWYSRWPRSSSSRTYSSVVVNTSLSSLQFWNPTPTEQLRE